MKAVLMGLESSDKQPHSWADGESKDLFRPDPSPPDWMANASASGTIVSRCGIPRHLPELQSQVPLPQRWPLGWPDLPTAADVKTRGSVPA
ncbi:hypothetical protein AAFF_G00141520 [Aldrovandia affinis]|uniref:Uncharacterized protein n=1 Tax=Aldrovandia affinis TaxID=143900 RepID=A0AAD7TDW1_9TELE|nr:hypothetical protein AAFF_G00141520 [Aldrovandia affinis]